MRNRPSPDLFARLPGHIRSLDAGEGRPLQALMAVLSDELGIIESDLDQLYDNWFIETCEPWVLPYIGGLIGATPMRDIGEDQAGLLRAYVANLLQYRQAKGTAAAVEQVARDLSGWPVVAVEFFQRVALSQHVNALRPQAVVFADVRNARAAKVSRSPFSTMAHSAAAGTPDGYAGRYGLPNLGLFIWRQMAAPLWPLLGPGDIYRGGPIAMPVQPKAQFPGLFRVDPLERDMPLVNRPDADLSIAARVTPKEVPLPITRDALAMALDTLRLTGTSPGNWFEQSPPLQILLNGAEVPAENLFCCNLETAQDGSFRRPVNAGEVLVDPELGRVSLHKDDEAKRLETAFAHSAPFEIGGGAYDRRGSVATWLSDFVIPQAAPPFQIGVARSLGLRNDGTGQVVGTMKEALAAWDAFAAATPNARGIIAVMDNADPYTWQAAGRKIALPAGSRLAIVAADWPATRLDGISQPRPVGQLTPMHRRPIFGGEIDVTAADAGESEPAMLVLDGIVMRRRIVLKPSGDLGALRLYNCSVGANGPDLGSAVTNQGDNARLHMVAERCILGRCDLGQATGALMLDRCVIDEDLTANGAPPSIVSLKAEQMDATICGSTLFGKASMRSIFAENSILLGPITLAHRQTGCVRYCFTRANSQLPRRYACVPHGLDDADIVPVFTSTRFRDVGFAQLNTCTPESIREGADGGMEMGVGYANRDPARIANIRDAVVEFAPFGLSPGLIFMS